MITWLTTASNSPLDTVALILGTMLFAENRWKSGIAVMIGVVILQTILRYYA